MKTETSSKLQIKYDSNYCLPIATGAAAAAGIAMMATVGNLGVAPITLGLVKQATDHHEYGLYTMAAAMLVGAVLMLLLPKLRSAAVADTPVPAV